MITCIKKLCCTVILLGFLVVSCAYSFEVELAPSERLCHPNQKITLNLSTQKSSNILVGTGLWSHRYGLTTGLPY